MYTVILFIDHNHKTETYKNMTAREFGEFLLNMSENYILLYDTSFSQPSVGVTIYMTAQERK